MASRTPSPQVIKEAVLSFFARRIATAMFQWDKRNVDAELSQQSALVQQEYERLGLFVALQSDKDALRPALYAAADALVLTGLDSLTPRQRGQAVLLFTRGLKAMREHLTGQSHPDHRDLMAALVERDQAAGVDQPPAHSIPVVDLAELKTTTGVQ